MATINQNRLAQVVTLAEGGKKNTDVAQVKEVQRLTLIELARHKDTEIIALIDAVRKREKVGLQYVGP